MRWRSLSPPGACSHSRPLLRPLGPASPGWPCSLTGRTGANGFFYVLHPHPNLAQMTLVMVGNRFLISKSCLAIPQKSRVGARYPLPSLPPSL